MLCALNQVCTLSLVTTQFIFEIENHYKDIQGAMIVKDFFSSKSTVTVLETLLITTHVYN